jgi:hypothetical protein
MLRQCLLAGASWSVWEPTTYSWFAQQGVTPAQKQVFDRYLPLCRLLLGRRILLEPNPLVFPKRESVYAGEGDEVVGADKNTAQDWEIFRGRSGDIVVSLVSRRKSCMDTNGFSRDLRFDLRVRETEKIARAHALGVDYDGEQEVKIERKGDGVLALTLPIHGAASLVVFEMDNGQAFLTQTASCAEPELENSLVCV